MKFKILFGKHAVKIPNTKEHQIFTAGSIFESDKPLDEIFLNKFQRLSEASEELSIPEPSNDTPEGEKSSPEPIEGSEISFKAVHKGRGNWDVLKVVDGEVTEEAANDVYLKRKAAHELADKLNSDSE